MAKIKNLVIYPNSSKRTLQSLAEEYSWMGREVRLSEDENGQKLTVLALPSKSKNKSKMEHKLRSRKEVPEDEF